MIIKDKLCACGCGQTGRIWSKKMLKQCFFRLNPPKSIKKTSTIKKISVKGIEKKKAKAEYTEKQFELFREIYAEHPTKRCYECNKWVDGQSSAQFHHLIFKSVAPKLALVKDNILLLCENCHSQIHSDSSKTPKTKELTQKIKEKYDLR